MSCWHGGHGCGPWQGVPYGPGWHDPRDWSEEADWPIRPRSRRPARPNPETAADDLEAKLEALRDEVRQVAAELASLRGGEAGVRER